MLPPRAPATNYAQALRVENNLLRGENASLAARCDALQKLVQEAVPEAAARLE